MLDIGLNHPFFMIAVGSVMVVLLALTMRSVVLRDRAMARARHADAVRAAYEQRWRDRGAA